MSLSLSTVKCNRRPATAHQGSSPREQSRSRFPGPRCRQVPLTTPSFPSHQTVGQHQPGGHSTGERDLGRICVVWGKWSRCTRQTAEPSPCRPAKVPCLPFLEGRGGGGQRGGRAGRATSAAGEPVPGRLSCPPTPTARLSVPVCTPSHSPDPVAMCRHKATCPTSLRRTEHSCSPRRPRAGHPGGSVG